MNSQNPSRLNIGFVLFCAAVTGVGGFLFGYDTAVINGANTFLQEHFGLSKETHPLMVGLLTASAIVGCILGATAAGFISDRFGRRRVLFFCAILYALSGILSAIPERLSFLTSLWHGIMGSEAGEADTIALFILVRILSGVAIGVSSMVCPVYIAEIAPRAWRGRLGTLFQLGIVTGIFLTLFVNLRIQGLGDDAWNLAYGWRWMLVAEAVPAFVFLFLLFGIPESPKWLIQADREQEARKTLDRIGGTSYADAEVSAVRDVLRQEEGTFAELFSHRYRLPLLIAFVLMVGSQFSGINAIMYYSTEIFKNATGDANAAFNSSMWIGLVNLLATFIAILLVDKAGRRALLLIGNGIQVFALGTVGLIYASNPQSPLLLWFVILYTAAFAMAMGPLPWVVCSEIFPAKLRGRAMSVSTFCIWAACLIVVLTVPQCMKSDPIMLTDTLAIHIGPSRTFWIYAACSAATFLFVLLFLPETKGKSLEEIEQSWHKQASAGD